MSRKFLLIPAAIGYFMGSQVHWALGIAFAAVVYFGASWLVGSSTGKERERLFVEAAARAEGLPSYRQLYSELDIVGESYRQSALRRLWNPDVTYDAVLIPEPDNPHDRNAVRVEISGIHVGYLSRETARTYREVMGAEQCRVPVHLMRGGPKGTIGVFTGKCKAGKKSEPAVRSRSASSPGAPR